jgi:hypothetical protein
MTEAEVKAEILDASEELVLAIINRINNGLLLWQIRDIIDRKTGTVEFYQTALDYRLDEQFPEDLLSEYLLESDTEVPPLPRDEAYDLLKEIGDNWDLSDHEYRNIRDAIYDAFKELHKERFPDWHNAHDPELTEEGNAETETTDAQA